jgi:hypothetical protein
MKACREGSERLDLFTSAIPAQKNAMCIGQIAPEGLRLPSRERALLAASPWESVEDPHELAADRSDENAQTLALARDAQVESGAAAPIFHSDLMGRLGR